MIFVPRKKLILPSRYKQRGSIILATGGAAAISTWKVTLSGETSSSSGTGAQRIGIRFNADGTTDRLTGSATYTQINSASDWIDQFVGAVAGDFYVRCSVINSGDAWSTQPAAVGTWVNLATAKEWYLEDASADPFTILANNADFQIRYKTGSPEDTGVYIYSVSSDA